MTTTISREDAVRTLRSRKSWLLVTHLRPDGDTVGSAAALCLALRGAGLTAFLFRNPQITEKYLRFAQPFFAPEGFSPEGVAAVDLADTNLFPIGFAGGVDLCVDHHPTNSGYAAKTLVEPDKSSAGEIVLALTRLLGSLTKEEADLLYVALSTDTGCFQYGNTNAASHRAAAELLTAGADVQRLNKELFRTASRSRLALEGNIYATLRAYAGGRANIAAVTLDMMKKCGATEDDCDDIASLPGRVAGNVVSAVVREMRPHHCKISVRSTAAVDSSAICARFGGGGHKMASGCEVDMTPDEAAETFGRLFEEALA